MPELPARKVGIIACSGEEIAEGTVTRLAALQVLERLRPRQTVTICLPLFLAGGEGDRAFARFYPTIAVDGCDKRCAARATAMHSGTPAASIVVTEVVREEGIGVVQGRRRLNEAGLAAVATTAGRVAAVVDRLLAGSWDRRTGAPRGIVEHGSERTGPEAQGAASAAPQEEIQATCSCGSGIPVQDVRIGGALVPLMGLPLVFERFMQAGKSADSEVAREMLEVVRIYNPVPADADAAYASALLREYAAFLSGRGTVP